jgi:hypothetical protein
MNNSNYSEIYKNFIQLNGSELSKFEQIALVIHAVFIKNNFVYQNNTKLLDSDWNKTYNKAEFEYVYKGNCNVKVDISTADGQINIKVSASCQGNNTNFNTTLQVDDEKLTKLDFNNLNDTISDIENFIKNTYINEIEKIITSSVPQNNNTLIIHPDEIIRDPRNFGQPDPEIFPGGNVQGGGFNPFSNPYFSTGGGSVGGNYVGPNSDIFTGGFQGGNIHPSGQPGVRFDPIGPFGVFGGPEKKKDIKKTDPYSGGNPFGGDPFPNMKKGPFGGGHGGSGPII